MKTFVGVWVGFTLLFFALVGLWVAARLTNALQYYTTPTLSNEPTLKYGERFFASKLITPKRGDFIAYYPEVPGSEHTVFVHRLCGLPGDTVEVRRGELYVNGRDADAGRTLAHHYALPTAAYWALPAAARRDTAVVAFVGDRAYRVALTPAEAQRAGRARRLLLPPGEPDPYVSQHYPYPWNRDNFGPFVVPQARYFVLGDNRENALDSRYSKCPGTSRYVGTVLGR